MLFSNFLTDFLNSYPDKIQRLRNEGASDIKIKETLKRKELAAKERYGNRSTVAYLLEMSTPQKSSSLKPLKP